MPEHAIGTHHSSRSSASTRTPRARSLPSAKGFRVAVFFACLFYLGILVVLTAFFCTVAHPSQTGILVLLGSMGFSALAWLISFFKRRATCCPLCKGTPLLDSGARTHSRSWRLFPLNHGTTAILSILATQKFRCMYCGSDFDLLKPPTRLLNGDADPEFEES